MTELDITEFFNTECPRDYSASVAELGEDAGPTTWRHAHETAQEYNYVTDENRETVIDHFADYGAWDREALESYTNQHLCAMLIQDISGCMRDANLGPGNLIDWEAYEAGCEEGLYSGRIGRGSNGRIYFNIGG